MPSKTLSTHTLELETGMYIARLKYKSTVTLGVAAQLSSGVVSLFCSDQVSYNTLQSKNDSIVIRVSDAPVTLLMTGQKIDDLKALKLDKIVPLSTDINPDLRNNKSVILPVRHAEKISLSGHIAWQGDIKKGIGETLGDPENNKRLEGFAIHWNNKPNNVDIAYSCVIEDMGRNPVVLSGDFVGTRAKNRAILAVSISLIGKDSVNYSLEGYAVFSGIEPQKIKTGVECKGPTGQEHLVSLEIKVFHLI